MLAPGRIYKINPQSYMLCNIYIYIHTIQKGVIARRKFGRAI